MHCRQLSFFGSQEPDCSQDICCSSISCSSSQEGMPVYLVNLSVERRLKMPENAGMFITTAAGTNGFSCCRRFKRQACPPAQQHPKWVFQGYTSQWSTTWLCFCILLSFAYAGQTFWVPGLKKSLRSLDFVPGYLMIMVNWLQRNVIMLLLYVHWYWFVLMDPLFLQVRKL